MPQVSLRQRAPRWQKVPRAGILCITSLRARVAPGAPIIVRPAGPSEATDALLPEPKRIKLRTMKRQALGRGLDGALGPGPDWVRDNLGTYASPSSAEESLRSVAIGIT